MMEIQLNHIKIVDKHCIKNYCKCWDSRTHGMFLSGVPDYFGRNKISSGGDLSHYSSASLY